MFIQRAILVAATLVLSATGVSAQDGSRAEVRRQEIDRNAQSTLDALFAAQPPARESYDRSAGHAVFIATKAGFIVSGGSGTGVAVNKATGQRTYMRMGTGGVGLGIGAQRYSMIVFFENEQALSRFTAGGWDSSATAEAAAGKDGIAVRSSFIDGMMFYQLTDKGLMAHADVTGTRFWVIDELR